MNDEGFQHLIYEGMAATAYTGGPLLALAAAIGLSVGILQAAMQLQEQTFPQIVKICALSFAIYVMGVRLANPFVTFAEKMFSFASLGQ